MKTLHLTVKKRWFDLIKKGIKKTEYREYKPYWIARLKDKKFNIIQFKNGYGKNAPTIRVEYFGYWTLDTDGSVGVNGEELKGKYFVLNLGDTLK